jgi:hypothetical protein
LENDKYENGHEHFQSIHEKHVPWINKKSFFWLSWGKFEEKFYQFDSAVSLYELGMKYSLQV